MNYATVKRDGYEVPLIGIPVSAVKEECEGCRKEFDMDLLEFTGAQMLCENCRKQKT